MCWPLPGYVDCEQIVPESQAVLKAVFDRSPQTKMHRKAAEFQTVSETV